MNWWPSKIFSLSWILLLHCINLQSNLMQLLLPPLQHIATTSFITYLLPKWTLWLTSLWRWFYPSRISFPLKTSYVYHSAIIGFSIYLWVDGSLTSILGKRVGCRSCLSLNVTTRNISFVIFAWFCTFLTSQRSLNRQIRGSSPSTFYVVWALKE